MKDIIYDILISAITLSLLISAVLPSAKGNLSTVASMACREDRRRSTDLKPELINEQGCPAAFADGSDIISLIRYYEGGLVTIEVFKQDGGSFIYTGGEYDPGIFRIPYEGLFECSCVFSEDIPAIITFTEKDP
ncbi:MAG: hypothetical protein PHG48_02250 [Eubacteriales bacterium]|nr:hypothetical protein [Eubacteriales bacterium]